MPCLGEKKSERVNILRNHSLAIREKPGSSVTLELWRRKKKTWGAAGTSPAMQVQLGGRPKSYAGALKTPTINPKTLVDAKSLADAKRSVHTKNSADAKWSKDASRVAYARRRANASDP